jgi:hypothetical protein
MSGGLRSSRDMSEVMIYEEVLGATVEESIKGMLQTDEINLIVR